MSAEDAIREEVIAVKCMNSNIIHTDRFDNRRTLAYKCGAGTYYLRILNDTLEPIKIGTYYIVKLGSSPTCLAINIPENEVENNIITIKNNETLEEYKVKKENIIDFLDSKIGD